jgi:copper(I)-binding protein
MDEVGSIEVAPHATLKFAPGGYHLMCMMPSAGLRPGGHVAVTLDFADGAKVTGDFVIRNAAGK